MKSEINVESLVTSKLELEELRAQREILNVQKEDEAMDEVDDLRSQLLFLREGKEDKLLISDNIFLFSTGELKLYFKEAELFQLMRGGIFLLALVISIFSLTLVPLLVLFGVSQWIGLFPILMGTLGFWFHLGGWKQLRGILPISFVGGYEKWNPYGDIPASLMAQKLAHRLETDIKKMEAEKEAILTLINEKESPKALPRPVEGQE